MSLLLEIKTRLIELRLDLLEVHSLSAKLCENLNRQFEPLVDLDGLIGLSIKLGSGPDKTGPDQLSSDYFAAVAHGGHAYEFVESLVALCFL